MAPAAFGPDVGPYRVVRTLGAGGMGTVWLAEDTRLHRQVALKVFSGPEAEGTIGRQRMLREARAVATLNHPHIAAVHDVLDVDGRVVIVFEYIEGETLAARIARGALPLAESLACARQLASALGAAHARGIVHRDLKPSNVMLTSTGEVKVLDFGIARMLHHETATAGQGGTTAPGVLVGTPGYAAPEQWLGQHVDERADIYALGVVLFEMITGHRPYTGSGAMALAGDVLQREAPRAGSLDARVPPALDALVAAALSRDAAARPGSAREVEAALVQVQADMASSAARPPAGGWQPLSWSALRRPSARWAAVMLGVAALLAVAAAAIVPWRRGPAVADVAARPPVIAVLPLTNMGGAADQEYLAAGVADSLITNLASLPDVTVLSRRSVMDAYGRQTNVAGLAQDLDATYLVDGSVQQAGARLRISLTLLRPDGSVAWGDSAEGEPDDTFELQAGLVAALGDALEVRLSAQDRRRLEQPPTGDTAALRAYWQGRALLDRRDLAGNVDAAIAALSQAVEDDNRFALAYAALGEAYWARWRTARDAADVKRATDAGTTALRLDGDRPEVRYALAITLAGSGRLAEAIDELHYALALRPNYDDARRQLGRVLEQQGKIDEAVAEFRKAAALRPNAWAVYSDMGLMLYRAARYTDAIAAFERVAALRPDSSIGFQQLGTVYQQLGDTARALHYYAEATARQPTPEVFSNIGAIHHERGEYAEAVDAYSKAIALRPSSHITHRNLGDAYRRMGRTREAREAYSTAVTLVENELSVNPNDARRLASLAVYLEKAGDDAAARERLDRALRLAPSDVQVQYRAAVVHALAGRPGPALQALEEALSRGYSRASARQDEDLESLRTSPRYNTLVTVKPSGGPE